MSQTLTENTGTAAWEQRAHLSRARGHGAAGLLKQDQPARHLVGGQLHTPGHIQPLQTWEFSQSEDSSARSGFNLDTNEDFCRIRIQHDIFWDSSS
jgi:hypothetical protein